MLLLLTLRSPSAAIVSLLARVRSREEAPECELNRDAELLFAIRVEKNSTETDNDSIYAVIWRPPRLNRADVRQESVSPDNK